jgi:hypothetical protein
MAKRKMAELDEEVPVHAIAALDAAHAEAVASNLPRVEVIDGGLYRIGPDGKKELIRTLPPRKKAGRSKRSKT